MPRSIFYEGYDIEGFKKACGIEPNTALTPIIERHTLVKEIVYAKYKNQLRKDLKKAVTQLKRKAKAKPKAVKATKKVAKRSKSNGLHQSKQGKHAKELSRL